MAMPGEEETDYNKKDPLWVAIPHVNLPPRTPLAVLPTLTEHDYLLRTSDKYDPKAAKEAAKADKKKKRKPRIEDNDDEEEEEVEVDWENFDFSKSLPSGGESDDFFSLFDDASTNKPVMVDPAVLEEQAMLQEYHQEPDNYGVGGVSESVHRQLERNLVIQRQWKTPLAWLENEDFHNHVPFEVWGNYDQKLVVDHDDEVWDEDMYSKMAVNRLRNLTNFYLRDHLLIADKLNTIASKKRYLEELLDTNDMSLSYPTNQSIPNYLIPDKNRGVVYSDNLMELKSRIVLAPAVLPPKEAFGHEEFGYNDEVKPVNLVGTVRAQYDWTPDESLLPYSIEKSKLSYIQPILHFMGNVAELKSTKVRDSLSSYYCVVDC